MQKFLFCSHHAPLSKRLVSTLPKRVPMSLPSAGLESVFGATCVLHLRGARQGMGGSIECGGAGGTQSLALGCTSNIITIRWRIKITEAMMQKCLLCRLHAPLSRRVPGDHCRALDLFHCSQLSSGEVLGAYQGGGDGRC